jgi:hypothetical protein
MSLFRAFATCTPVRQSVTEPINPLNLSAPYYAHSVRQKPLEPLVPLNYVISAVGSATAVNFELI